MTPGKGTLLVANPFLKDPNFLRTVVLMCNHDEEGAFGLTLTRQLPLTLTDILPDATSSKFPVYLGGPVQPEAFHFLHEYPDLISGSLEISDGVFLGGNFETMLALLNNDSFDPNKIKFFVGYSGWGPEQLDNELGEDSWLTVSATRRILFNVEPENVWKEALREMGGPYDGMINYPLDPQMN